MQAQIEKNLDLRKDVLDNCRVVCLIARNRRKEPIVPNDVNTPIDDELSSGSSSPSSLSPTKDARGSTKAKSHKRSSQHPVFNDTVSRTSRRARREAGMRQNQSI